MRLPRGVDQRQVMQAMLDQGVATRRGIMCAHLEGAYAARPLRLPLPRSECARDGCILLPLFSQMSNIDQERVSAALDVAVRSADRMDRHRYRRGACEIE